MLLKVTQVTPIALLLAAAASARAEPLPPELDCFPSRVHAAIFRNWDIVTHDRLATTLGTDVAAIRKAGDAMGLPAPEPLTPEKVRRNIEMVLRRNWPVLPRPQIESLLGMSGADLDEFLAKEIFLRALLAAPPDGLAPLAYAEPDAATAARLDWFRARVRRHLDASAPAQEEPRLAYIAELCRPHDPSDFLPDAEPGPDDVDLRSPLLIVSPDRPGSVLEGAIKDFADYCRQVQRVGVSEINLADQAFEPKPDVHVIALSLVSEGPPRDGYTLHFAPRARNQLEIHAATETGLYRGLIEIERRMGERGGPFVARAKEEDRRSPSIAPRFVSSYFSLMTDVLGQDLIDPFPDGYLARIAHQDADGVWVYALLRDLVPSPAFDGMGIGGEARLRRLRDLVGRAAKHGLKVYLYLNEPRAQFLPFFEKRADVKGQVEGNTAALCTSTEAVRKHLRGSFERLFREVPGLGGVVLITASENLTNCYSHGLNIACPRCLARKPAEVVAESIRCMAEGAWAADPKAKVIVWDWSWHSVLGDDPQEGLVQLLPKGCALMADFERGTPITRGGEPRACDEYSISVIGPSPRARTRAEQARRYGLDFFAKVQLSTTWECGTVPFIPVPGLLARKAAAMREAGVTGAMATWTIGSYPSPNTEAFSLANWDASLTPEQALRRVALRRYGPGAVDAAVKGWTTLGTAFSEEFPFSWAIYVGPFQHGPSIPLYRRDIPPPYGRCSLLDPKDDWRAWCNAYTPEGYAAQLRKLCGRWAPGLADLKEAVAKAAAPRRRTAERDLGVAWMVDYTYRAFANDVDFYRARDAGNAEEMRRIAREELAATTEAFRLVRSDSRLGWEAELQYFYRPLDVLERLLSLDAALEPPP